MFKSICLRRQQADVTAPLDLGFLAEAMLFYENVHQGFAPLSLPAQLKLEDKLKLSRSREASSLPLVKP